MSNPAVPHGAPPRGLSCLDMCISRVSWLSVEHFSIYSTFQLFRDCRQGVADIGEKQKQIGRQVGDLDDRCREQC